MQVPRDSEDPFRFTYLAIGVFLGGMTAAVVASQERKANRPTRTPGRLGFFSPEISAWIGGQAAERFQSNNRLSYPRLLDALQYDFGIVISAAALRYRIRNIESVKSLLGIPTEAERVAVPRQFVFNVGETG
jgi:hypothetical protein